MTEFIKDLWRAFAAGGRDEFQFTRGLVTRGKLAGHGNVAPERKVAGDGKVVAYRRVALPSKTAVPAGSASAQILYFPATPG